MALLDGDADDEDQVDRQAAAFVIGELVTSQFKKR
jgi:hypothetical protein